MPVEHSFWVDSGKKVSSKELFELLQQGKYPQHGSGNLEIQISKEAKLFLSEIGIKVAVVRLGELDGGRQFGMEAILNESDDEYLNILASYGCVMTSVWKEVEYDW